MRLFTRAVTSTSFPLCRPSACHRRFASDPPPPNSAASSSRANVVPFTLSQQDAHVALQKVALSLSSPPPCCTSSLAPAVLRQRTNERRQPAQAGSRSFRSPSLVVHHTSHVTRHTSHVTRHTPKRSLHPPSTMSLCLTIDQVKPHATLRQCYVPAYLVRAGVTCDV